MGEVARARQERGVVWLALAIVAIGGGIRLYYVLHTYLNPDEAMHFLFANTQGWSDALRRSRSTAHPPLFLLVLHLAIGLGDAEWVVRLPSLLTGTAALWLAFRWLQQVAGDAAAIAGLVFLTCVPGMISTAIEVRQYGLLMLGICAALYCMERFLTERSRGWVAAFAASLYVAILSHYTAAWVTLALGIYVAVRLWTERLPGSVTRAWAASQLGAAAIYSWLYVTHLQRLHGGGMEQTATAGWLKYSYFQTSGESLAAFMLRAIVEAFQYLAGGPLPGALVVALYVAGFVIIVTAWPRGGPPLRRDVALLCVLPLLIGAAGAGARWLPFGGTRHVTYLLPFVAASVSVALTRTVLRRVSWVVLASLVVAPVWLAVSAPANSIERMNRQDMVAALEYWQGAIPKETLVFTDRETHLVLAYYLARAQRDLLLPSPDRFKETRLGGYRVVSIPEQWRFTADKLPAQLVELSSSLALQPAEPVWLMGVGWSTRLPFETRLPPQAVLSRREFGSIVVLQTAVGYW